MNASSANALVTPSEPKTSAANTGNANSNECFLFICFICWKKENSYLRDGQN